MKTFTAALCCLFLSACATPAGLTLRVTHPPTGQPMLRRDGTPLPDKYLLAIERDVLNQTLATINFMELRTWGRHVPGEKYQHLVGPVFEVLDAARQGQGEDRYALRIASSDQGRLSTAQRLILLHGLSQIFYLHQQYRGHLPSDEEMSEVVRPFFAVEAGEQEREQKRGEQERGRH